jgi:hypothetical protein
MTPPPITTTRARSGNTGAAIVRTLQLSANLHAFAQP